MKSGKKNHEMKVYGRHAAHSLYKNRPEGIIRAYVTQETLFEFKPIIRYCVDNKLAYHVVTSEELDDITKASHHEGVALLVKNKPLPGLKEIFAGEGVVLALDGVENPHNLGAILRTCAHFGVKGVIYKAKVPVALTGAAYRTSEGGAEIVDSLHIQDWAPILGEAKAKGFEIYATSSHQGDSLYKTKFSNASLVFMGAEGEGLSGDLLKKISRHLQIPGTESVESLNVSSATAVILSEWFRQSQF
jgi:RNA methyltransferase, TrmH family